MKYLRRVVVVLICVTALFAGQKPTSADWRTGLLVDATSEHGKRVVGSVYNGNGSLGARRDDATYYQIETPDMTYILKRALTRRNDKQLRVTVNSQVKFAILGDSAFLQDEDGKEHKLELEKKIAKTK